MRGIGLFFLLVLSVAEGLCNTTNPVTGSDTASGRYEVQGTDVSFTAYVNSTDVPKLLSPLQRQPLSGNDYDYFSFNSYDKRSASICKGVGAYSGFIVAAGLITYGAVAQCNPLLKKVNAETASTALRLFPGRMHVDDYLQYAPVAAYLALDFSGVKARHNMLQRTVVAATSYLFMAAIVNSMKFAIPVLRPDGSAWNSFPSGHTATAFTGAHLLFREYKETSPWIGIAGYAVATTTGIMRMLNRRHWLSDVAAGAGIGILSVELSYLLLPVFDKLVYGKGEKKRNSSMTLMPAVGNGYYGAAFACVF